MSRTFIPSFLQNGLAKGALVLLIFFLGNAAYAQNYLKQSFDSTAFPPAGWANVYISGTSDDGGDTTWYRMTGGSSSVHPASTPTHSGAGMASYNSFNMRNGAEALLITPAIDMTVYPTGGNEVSFWFYKETDYADGWYGNQQDQLNVWVNTSPSIGSGAILMDSYYNGIGETPMVSSMGWYKYTLRLPSSMMTSTHVYIIFDAVSNYATDLFLDDISVDHLPPCSGTPSVNLMPKASYSAVCSGKRDSLFGQSDSYLPGQMFQWQTATSPTGPWTNIAGATDTSYYTPAISGTVYYRLKDSCTGSGNVGYSLADTFVAGTATYARLPYVQSFETWQNFCDRYDVPAGGNWINTPSTGEGSWRRDDQGCSYGGWNIYGCSSYTVHTYSPYTVAHGGSHTARFHSSPDYGGYLSSTSTPWSGSLDLYVDCSGSGDKLLQFFFKNQAYPYSGTSFALYNNDSLDVFLSTDGGATFKEIWGADTAQEWKKIRLDIASTSANTIIRFFAKRNGGDPMGYGYTDDRTDIGLDSVYVGPTCTGVTAVTTTPSGVLSACPGAPYTFNIGKLPLTGGLTYQWEQATAPFSSFSTVAGGTGSNSYTYTTPPLFDSIKYRAIVTCPYTSISDTTPVLTVAMSNKPSYAAINLPAPAGPGYHYSFENWNNRCSRSDAPVVKAGSNLSNWANYPSTGPNSWRREDQGSTASWSYTSTSYPYMYSPAAVDSSHSARFMTYYHTAGADNRGNLYLFLDCSTIPGTKELQYYVNTKSATSSSNSTDTLTAWLSTDGGSTYTRLRQDWGGDGSWKFVRVDIPSNSAKTVINFQSVMSNYYSYGQGIGLDNVKVLLPCNGMPTAGTLTGDSVCANETFTRQLSGTSEMGGLSYIWQESADKITWKDVVGDTDKIALLSYAGNMYIRAIVKCRYSGLADTSNAALIYIKPFYKCYCDPVKTVTSPYIYAGFGNVSIVSASNGDTVMSSNTTTMPVTYNPWVRSLYTGGSRAALHGHTDFTDTFPAPTIYPDSLYRFYITEVCTYSFYSGYPINVYIDYDHSGTFDNAASGELVLNQKASSVSLPTVTDTTRVPHDAMLGITGMRVMMGIYMSSPLNPCGTTSSSQYGEIRDYLVNIDYRPCAGKLDAGMVVSTDSTMCKDYTFMLADTTHEHHRSASTWNWQYSPDGKTWGNIPGTEKRDTLTQIFTSTVWYRLQIICLYTHDTAYSAPYRVKEGEAYQCYCHSEAIGGVKNDSSDIGAFMFGPFVMNKKGPHVLNPAAVRGHTSFVDNTIELYVDSTYPIGLYQILKTPNHGDAKVTLFMDYNNNLKYDAPAERVWTAYTSAAYWYITTAITIPELVVSDVPTGMRLILNNNVGANAASDEGCGTYTSGETMDFVVRFNRAWTAGVGSISNLENLMMYPNPTDGKFKVTFNSQQVIKNLQVSVTNMTGQQVFARSYTNTQGQFNTEIDLSAAARGVYFVTFMADGERMIRKIVLK